MTTSEKRWHEWKWKWHLTFAPSFYFSAIWCNLYCYQFFFLFSRADEKKNNLVASMKNCTKIFPLIYAQVKIIIFPKIRFSFFFFLVCKLKMLNWTKFTDLIECSSSESQDKKIEQIDGSTEKKNERKSNFHSLSRDQVKIHICIRNK